MDTKHRRQRFDPVLDIITQNDIKGCIQVASEASIDDLIKHIGPVNDRGCLKHCTIKIGKSRQKIS